ncbi:MAG TPA: fasciclin domain-containing protein [Streptosporangiaceae bacterium]|nr:fasciclin domain-containing protein [Streptosporangiaceae bacterium]
MRPGLASIAMVLTLAVVGCGTTTPSPASPTGSPVPATNPAGGSTAAHVGSGCGFIPERGSGSFRSMSTQRVVAAVASNPQLSVFTSAIKTAALDGRLNALHAFTLFIPVNSAFSALSKSQVTYLRKPTNLSAVVRHQVVPASVTPARIARGVTVSSLSGARLTLAKHGLQYQVNGATVVCGNIKTANGTLYVIDRVLLPHH